MYWNIVYYSLQHLQLLDLPWISSQGQIKLTELILSPSPPLQSLWPRWRAYARAGSLKLCGACPAPCRRSTASPWCSGAPGRAWTWCVPARRRRSAGCEASAPSRSTWPTWRRRRSWINILCPVSDGPGIQSGAAEAALLSHALFPHPSARAKTSRAGRDKKSRLNLVSDS